jgi:hypothetical protein
MLEVAPRPVVSIPVTTIHAKCNGVYPDEKDPGISAVRVVSQ